MSQTAIQHNVCDLLLLKSAYENLIYIFFHTKSNYLGFKCLFIIFVIAKHEDLMHTEYISEGISNAIKLKFILR